MKAVNVGGVIKLGGALELAVTQAASAGSEFVLIRNDGSGPVIGTFVGLPEGTEINAGPARFRIGYIGGDGNDLVLRQTESGVRENFSQPKVLADGTLELKAVGVPDTDYDLEVLADFNPPFNRVRLITLRSGPDGNLGFTDTEARDLPSRFYRFQRR